MNRIIAWFRRICQLLSEIFKTEGPLESSRFEDSAFVDLIRDHLHRMPPNQRVVYLVKMLWGSKYGWGNEYLGSVDCSGSLSWALYLLGYDIRTTAQVFYDIFTEPIDYGTLPFPGDLVFWTDVHHTRIQHMAIFSDHMMVMNASVKEGFEDVPLSMEMRLRREARYSLRKLNWMLLEDHRHSGQHSWGIDPQLRPLFGLFYMGKEAFI